MQTTVKYLDMMDKEVADQIKWHEANNHFNNDREKQAYLAGYQQAARTAWSVITLHNFHKP